MSEKPKIALYWCAGCGGCDEAVVDLAEGILDLVSLVDIVFWPVALDMKRPDVEQLADAALLASLINGAIRNEEQEEMAHLLRRKSKYVIAFGACAQYGGVPGLANLFNREQILNAVFRESPSTEAAAIVPQLVSQRDHSLVLPEFQERVRTLDQVVEVDYYIPGCPPSTKVVSTALLALIRGELPPVGNTLAPDYALCEECSRKESKPEKLDLAAFHRVHEIEADPKKCLLAQGIVCLGVGTRAGCDAVCIKGNMPCTGCGGATTNVRDHGAKLLSALASNLTASCESEIDSALEALPDAVGTIYRYSVPGSMMQGAVQAK